MSKKEKYITLKLTEREVLCLSEMAKLVLKMNIFNDDKGYLIRSFIEDTQVKIHDKLLKSKKND